MVTHDRYFLERVCNEIIELDEGEIYKYSGNYSYFLEKKEARLASRGIKVLSLFFVDRVANYRQYTDGEASKGKFARWFEEIYEQYRQKPQYKNVLPYSAEQVHNGYFSCDRKGILKDTGGDSLADDDTYMLIMKGKERLLSADEPLRFIFSHSELREGWDKPCLSG